MEKYKSAFKAFYSGYSMQEAAKTTNKDINQLALFDHDNDSDFIAEVRMKNDTLAMRLTLNSYPDRELLSNICYYFDHYSEEKNCVWTNDRRNIRKFFRTGAETFSSLGGKIRINFELEEKERTIYILDIFDHIKSDETKQKMCEHFYLLEKCGWYSFADKIEDMIKAEQEEKHAEEVTCMDLPLDWNNIFSSDERAADVHADSIADGLILSLNRLGYVDIEYISQITGEDYKAVISGLSGSIYQNPATWNECFYKGWETADEYLSGRVEEKLKLAKQANKKYKGYFSNNIKALKKILPGGIHADEIYVTLGSPWVPIDIIDQFIEYLLGDARKEPSSKQSLRVRHDEETGTWKVPVKACYKGQIGSDTVYGTKRLEAGYIIERTLNMKSVFVTDEAESETSKSGKKRVLNQEETMLAVEKQKKIIEAFKKWIWADEKRKNRLVKIYREKYCSNVIKYYNGDFLSFPEMNPEERLFDYQKNAVARIMLSPNTLLAHEVGAGKTYIMIAAGMEMRRIGTSKKNLYVVPNSLVGQ